MPTAPAVACRCGKLDCAEHSRKANAKQHDRWRGNASARGYGHHWTARIRPMVLRRDPMCRDPFESNCGNKSDCADHILPRAAGGTNAIEHNLQGLCRDCHNRKTKLEQMVRFRQACDCEIMTRACLVHEDRTITILVACDAHAPAGWFPLSDWVRQAVAAGVGRV